MIIGVGAGMGRKKDPKNMTPKERVDKYRVSKYKTTRYGDTEPIMTGDQTAALTLILDSLHHYGGHPFKYPPTAEGLQLFVERSEDFFEYVHNLNAREDIEKKLIPDVECWTVYLGISRRTLFEYEGRGGQWADTINYIKNIINTSKKQLAMNFKIPPMLYMFDATNNHNYVNTSEFKLQATTIINQNPDSELERELLSNGITWDAKQGEFNVIDVKGEYVNADIRPNSESNKGLSIEEGAESGTETLPGATQEGEA